MDFETDFGRWLEASVTHGVPSNVVGFSFNLYEPAFESGVKFGIELVGTEAFDEEDED